MKPTLLVLAAGMGSRYGGLKQLDRFGPSGETIMDYSVYDALGAGFGKVVFVIRRELESAFRAAVGDKYASRVPVEYVFQQLDDLPPGFTVPAGRTKPWGTTHAIWSARRAIAEPFVSINADDYYGKTSFKAVAERLRRGTLVGERGGLLHGRLPGPADPLRACGRDARDLQGRRPAGSSRLWSSARRWRRAGDGGRYLDDAGKAHLLNGDEVVSMNFWGFTPSVFDHLERHLARFLELQAPRREPPNA